MEKKEEYQLSLSVNDGILEITLTGTMMESYIKQVTNDLIDITKAKNIKKMLVNVSSLKRQLAYFETYQRVRNYPDDLYRIKFAMVDNKGLNEYEQFHETTAINAGITLKWFTDIDTARAWLKSK
jgi:hypothetical protein